LGGKAMIWCVEDDAGIRDIEVYTLKSTGFEAEGFCDGADFFNALAKEKPELVILDVMLPDVDGFTLCSEIRKKYNFPVIMLTARTSDADKISGLTLGADDYISLLEK
jgi:two-component system alkaline phosphatase synthesis response regulator PhoP